MDRLCATHSSVKLTNLTADKPSRTSFAKSTSTSHQAKAAGSKPETKVLEGTEDSAYSSEEESDDDRRGGWKILGLLKEVSKPCRPKGETKKMARCLGSKGKCHQILSPKFYSIVMCYIKDVEQHGGGHCYGITSYITKYAKRTQCQAWLDTWLVVYKQFNDVP